MNLPPLINRLQNFARVLPVLVDSTSPADARWRPPSGNWSILEIVCHLGDEEVEDFRQRLRLTLENPGQAWPPIDPEQAAIDRDYNSRELPAAVLRFVDERQQSVDWLKNSLVEQPDWNQAYKHPRFGSIAAGQILAAWVAHDQLHLRQIAKRFYELGTRDAAPFGNDYAGNW